mgnify:CR=1 FL=1
MNNEQVVALLLELARGVEFLDDNPFKTRAYRKAAMAIETQERSVVELIENAEIHTIDGIGKAIAAKLEAWVQRGDFSALENVRSALPHGFDELEKVPGLGLKRIRTLFHEHGIASVDELLEHLEAGSLTGVRGFSEKTRAKMLDAARQIISYRGKYLIDATLGHAREIINQLEQGGIRAVLTGECRRGMEIYTHIDILVEAVPSWVDTAQKILGNDFVWKHEGEQLLVTAPGKPPVRFHPTEPEHAISALFMTTGSDEHLHNLRDFASEKGFEIREDGIFHGENRVALTDEREIYEQLGLQYLPPEVREGREIELLLAQQAHVPELITRHDLRGILHVHTLFSDGRSSLLEMVKKARDMGFSWIGISDHSESAYYAGGMDIGKITQQRATIEQVRATVPEISILQGIEADILSDGSLDYPDEILEMFDFVIASIHSQMEMDEARMTQRILRAIRNPYTSILAHPSGRLLLSREPYRVDLSIILDEATRHSVAMELNANPWRLDLDWRLVYEFISSGGKIIIGPDAHSREGLEDIEYGIMMARKGVATPQVCLNTREEKEIRGVLKGSWT